MATQMSYNRARSTQKIFLNNYWMEIDGHYTFRTLLVVYSNVSTLRKYVLLQKKKQKYLLQWEVLLFFQKKVIFFDNYCTEGFSLLYSCYQLNVTFHSSVKTYVLWSLTEAFYTCTCTCCALLIGSNANTHYYVLYYASEWVLIKMPHCQWRYENKIKIEIQIIRRFLCVHIYSM